METRQKTEYKIYVLSLANMRGGIDKINPIAIFTNYEELKNWYNKQLASEPYIDSDSDTLDFYGNKRNWQKVFSKESVLEWMNPADKLDIVNENEIWTGGVYEDWVDFFPSRENIHESILFNP